MLEKCLWVSGIPSSLKIPISLHHMEKTPRWLPQIRCTTFPWLNWNEINLPKIQFCYTIQIRSAASWIFRVRLCTNSDHERCIFHTGIPISLQITTEVWVSLYVYQGDLLCLGLKMMQTVVGEEHFLFWGKATQFQGQCSLMFLWKIWIQESNVH